uniref:Putative tick transposon n=1 Tax=Ixodes ricinus TaxID=34613 RepID=A0A6B0V3M4_IXORI
MCFFSPLKRVILNKPILLHASDCTSCECVPVDYVNTTKYLGIYFDSDLSWNSHLFYIMKKLRAASCTLYNIRTFIPMSTRRLIVHALVYSVIRYGITLFGQCTNLLETKVNSLLKGILRSVAYGSNIQTSDNIFDDLSLPSFRALFMHTVILRHYWDNTFKVPNVVCRELRKVAPYATPRISTHLGTHIRSYYVPNTFNKLPPVLSDITSRGKIKRKLKTMCSSIG